MASAQKGRNFWRNSSMARNLRLRAGRNLRLRAATGWSLKGRMRALLIVGAIVPVLLAGVFVNTWVRTLYRRNTELTLEGELAQIKGNMELLMESMTYMSQVIATDAEFMTKLREATGDNDVVRASAMMYLNRRVNVYEGANPNISNMVLYTLQDGTVRLLNTGLVTQLTVREELLFSTQHLLRFYGPHPTRSIVSDYPAISLVRAMPVPGAEHIYLYMESGYRKLGTFAAETLDSIRAVYGVLSDAGHVVYASDPELIAPGTPVDVGAGSLLLGGREHYLHQVEGARGWRLCVFIPADTYQAYTWGLGIGFLAALLGAVALSLLANAFFWQQVNRPFTLFGENLRRVMLDSFETDIETMHVEEFDRSFAYFAQLKGQIIELLREMRDKEQQRATLAVKQLLYKINPHFIHNTLNTLKWYASDKGYGDIEAFLAAFNRLMHYNMEKDSHTTLESELSSMRDYIALQKLKYPIDFTVDVQVPGAMLQTETPRFILYPLVENAIMHGLQGRGSIHVVIALRTDGRIAVRVWDSGPPLAEEAVRRILADMEAPDGPGIGLRYVYQILRAQFGDACAVCIWPGDADDTAGDGVCTDGAAQADARGDGRMPAPRGNTFALIIPYAKGAFYAKSTDH